MRYREVYSTDAANDMLHTLRLSAFIVFILAIISDAFDGFIARFHNQKTLLGTILDPIADKLLLVSATIILSFPVGLQYRIPSWLTVSIVSRDILILLGALIVFILNGKVKFMPLFFGKMTTFCQMLMISLVLLQNKLSVLLFYVTLLFTIVSGILYVYREAKTVTFQNNHIE